MASIHEFLIFTLISLKMRWFSFSRTNVWVIFTPAKLSWRYAFMLEILRRTICQFKRMYFFVRNITAIIRGTAAIAASVRRVCRLNIRNEIKNNVKTSMSTFTIPFVKRSFRELTSFITLTIIFPAGLLSKNENDNPCKWSKRSWRSFAMAFRPATSIMRTLYLKQTAPNILEPIYLN